MTGTSTGGSSRRVSTAIAAALLSCSTSSSFPLHWTFTWNGHQAAGALDAGAGVGVPLHSSSPRSSEYDSSFDSNDSDNTRNDAGGNNRRSRRKSAATQIPDNRNNMYQVLGADPSMSRAEIKRLYIALAKETHPDAYAVSSPSNNNNNNSLSISNTNDYIYEDDSDRFNEIAQAWSILSDSKTRRAHDRELAARDFKEDIVKKASEVAREYGPAARKFYDDIAIPLLRRTTATTLAGLSAVAEEVASSEMKQQQQQQQPQQMGDASTMSNAKKLSGVTTLSEVVREVSEMKRVNLGAGGDALLEDFGRAFQRVIEASKNATRQIDGLELKEKSIDLRKRADEAQLESMEVLKQVTEIRLERLRLTFHSSLAEFTSSEAIQYLNGFNNGNHPSEDQVTLLQRMTFKHPIKQDIEAFAVAETEFDVKVQRKMEVDWQLNARQRAMEEAENNAKLAVEDEERARKMLEVAQKRVAESQKALVDAQKSLRDLDVTVKKADQEVSKARTMLKRKRDVVRQELKRKSNMVLDGPKMEQQLDSNGKVVRINPGYNRSSSMNVMGFEEQALANIESLLRDERRIENDFLRLVEKASRLVSRSERLRLRSEDLIGEQQISDVISNKMTDAVSMNSGAAN